MLYCCIVVMIWAQKRQANYIAPLQPPTLAPVKAWGSLEGAGRIAPAYA